MSRNLPEPMPGNHATVSLVKRHLFLIAGFTALALGSIGIFLPLLPTVPFVILAAFCFANSSPRLEAWLVEHHVFGNHIRNWRERRAITRRGKWAATIAFAASIILAAFFAPMPWAVVPVIAAIVGGTWIWTRNEPLPEEPTALSQDSSPPGS